MTKMLTPNVNQFSDWRQNPVTLWLAARFESELKRIQKYHNEAKYEDLCEVASIQAKVNLLELFLKSVFVTGSILTKEEVFSKEE